MSFIRINEDVNKLPQQFEAEYELFFNGKMQPIFFGENVRIENELWINHQYLTVTDNHILSNFTIHNRTHLYIPVKLFVKSNLQRGETNYVFGSPKRDVIFLCNRHGLFLTSGMIKNSTICQYGVLKRDEHVEKISQGSIPLYPIGTGDVIGIFTLEYELKPFEKVSAQTWMMFSKDFSEKNLLEWDQRLKSRLAFSKE